jgi:hypothetical protein
MVADWDGPDLLARFQLRGQWPTQGAGPITDIQIYQLLSDAQYDLYQDYAAHFPSILMGTPTQLTTADGGVTYTFGTDAGGDPIFPLACEVYAQVDGRALYASSFGNSAGDFVIEGSRIRAPQNVARSYNVGPIARWVTMPAAISATVGPTLQPKHARILIVLKALIKWANIGGIRDPQPYLEEYGDAWNRLLIALKTQFATRMQPAAVRDSRPIWSYVAVPLMP